MANKRRGHGDGAVDQRGPDVWRVRYRVAGKRFTRTIKGTRREAQQELRRLLRTADTGSHVAPGKITLEEWVEQWLAMGAPGRKRQEVGRRSLVRYRQLLAHVVSALGHRPLQQLRAAEIDAFYVALQGRGLGGQLMRPCLQIVDDTNLPAYLETTNPRTIPFYQRHGFEVTGEAQAGTCPPITFMQRAAR